MGEQAELDRGESSGRGIGGGFSRSGTARLAWLLVLYRLRYRTLHSGIQESVPDWTLSLGA